MADQTGEFMPAETEAMLYEAPARLVAPKTMLHLWSGHPRDSAALR